MLDLGANTEANDRNLVQFAIMGAAYSRILTGRDKPRVRLLNIGTEEIKGTEALRDAANQLQEATGLDMSFDGFVESDKINRGEVDVVVTDGFSGNIALKAIEGAYALSRVNTDGAQRPRDLTQSIDKQPLHLFRITC